MPEATKSAGAVDRYQHDICARAFLYHGHDPFQQLGRAVDDELPLTDHASLKVCSTSCLVLFPFSLHFPGPKRLEESSNLLS